MRLFEFKEPDASVSIFQEFLKLTVDLVDLFGLHFIIQRVSGKSQVKVGWFLFLLSNVVSEHLGLKTSCSFRSWLRVWAGRSPTSC